LTTGYRTNGSSRSTSQNQTPKAPTLSLQLKIQCMNNAFTIS
jgi:hypothetical protein